MIPNESTLRNKLNIVDKDNCVILSLENLLDQIINSMKEKMDDNLIPTNTQNMKLVILIDNLSCTRKSLIHFKMS